MTLGTLVLNIGICAIFLTLIVKYALKREESLWMSFLQNFCGALFIFSGWVKAVDPLGTAYKMEQYFAEFEITFQETWMSFVAPLFPWLSSISIGFSVFIVVFEIVLGVMLIIGFQRKITAWAFFLLVLLFTILTGFTYLTGYVPSGENFFSFGSWGPYKESNMRVTDCGCFGDFIKLKPRVSFFKDLVLMIPAILFIWRPKLMHQLFSPGIRSVVTGLSLVVLFIYCLSNYKWDLPSIDFRPFKEGADVAAIYKAEQEASGSVKIEKWRIQNKNDNQTVELSNEVFMQEWGKKYTKDEWEVKDQIKSQPSIPITKISDFEFVDEEGTPISEELLKDPGTTVMLVAYKLKGEYGTKKVMVPDTTFVMDTVWSENRDSFALTKKVVSIDQKEETEEFYLWDSKYEKDWEKASKFANEAMASGWKALGVVGGAGQQKLAMFQSDLGLDFPLYEADDILLKTIVRSNPGIVIWRNGKVVKKYHINKLPSFKELSSEI